MNKILLGITYFLFFQITVYADVLEDLKSLKYTDTGKSKIFLLISENVTSFNDVKESFIEELSNKYDMMIFQKEQELLNNKDIPAQILLKNPELILCIGSKALESLTGKINSVPILFAMVINYQKFHLEQYTNITGVSLQIPAESIFINFKTIHENFIRVGVISGKEYINSYLNQEKINLKNIGIYLLIDCINEPSELINSYQKIKKSIEVLWMVPDYSIFSLENILNLIKITRQEKMPFVVFSENFVKVGGLFSVSPNYRTIGSQLAVMAQKIIDDKITPVNISIAPVIGTILTINKNTARFIGLDLNKDNEINIDKIVE